MTLILRVCSAAVQFFVVGILPILVGLSDERIDTLNKLVLVAAMAKIGLDGLVLASGRQSANSRDLASGFPIALLAGYLLLASAMLSKVAGLELDAFASAYLFSLMSMTFMLHLMVSSRWWVLAFTPAIAITGFYSVWLLPAAVLLAALSARVRIDIDLRRVFSAKSLLLMLLGTFGPIYGYLSYRYLTGYFPPEIANVMGRLVSLTFLLKGVLNITDWRNGPDGRNLLTGRRGAAIFAVGVAVVAAASTINMALGVVAGFAFFFLIGPPYWRVLVAPVSISSAIVFCLTLLSLTELVFAWISLFWFFLVCAVAAMVLAFLSLRLGEPPASSNDGQNLIAPNHHPVGRRKRNGLVS